jgi:hypothetical protein
MTVVQDNFHSVASKLYKRYLAPLPTLFVSIITLGVINIHDPLGEIVYTIENPPYTVTVLSDSQFYSIFLVLLIMLILQLVNFVVRYTSTFLPRMKSRRVL